MSAPTETFRILGIDPGLRSGGAAYVELAGSSERVLAALSLVETEKQRKEAAGEAKRLKEGNSGWGDEKYTAVSLRAHRWRSEFIAFLDRISDEFGQPDLIAVESFIDQAQHARTLKANRYQTPHLTGLLEAALYERGFAVERGNLLYQDAGDVIPQHSSEIAALESRSRSKINEFAVVPGDEVITNDHMRKALAHALAASLRVRLGELAISTPTPTT